MFCLRPFKVLFLLLSAIVLFAEALDNTFPVEATNIFKSWRQDTFPKLSNAQKKLPEIILDNQVSESIINSCLNNLKFGYKSDALRSDGRVILVHRSYNPGEMRNPEGNRLVQGIVDSISSIMKSENPSKAKGVYWNQSEVISNEPTDDPNNSTINAIDKIKLTLSSFKSLNDDYVFEKDDLIGKGSYGRVTIAKEAFSQVDIALKIEELSPADSVLEKEYNICDRLKHDGIVKALRCEKYAHADGKTIIRAMAMEILGPNLETLLKLRFGIFSLKTICLIAFQLFARIEFVHLKDVLYLDLKPLNTVIGRDDEENLIHFLDFGVSLLLEEKQPAAYGDKLTPEYKSIVAGSGENNELCFWDDLESILYTILHLWRGSLPWLQKMLQNKLDATLRNFVCCKFRLELRNNPGELEKLCEGFPELIEAFRFVWSRSVKDLRTTARTQDNAQSSSTAAQEKDQSPSTAAQEKGQASNTPAQEKEQASSTSAQEKDHSSTATAQEKVQSSTAPTDEDDRSATVPTQDVNQSSAPYNDDHSIACKLLNELFEKRFLDEKFGFDNIFDWTGKTKFLADPEITTVGIGYENGATENPANYSHTYIVLVFSKYYSHCFNVLREKGFVKEIDLVLVYKATKLANGAPALKQPMKFTSKCDKNVTSITLILSLEKPGEGDPKISIDSRLERIVSKGFEDEMQGNQKFCNIGFGWKCGDEADIFVVIIATNEIMDALNSDRVSQCHLTRDENLMQKALDKVRTLSGNLDDRGSLRRKSESGDLSKIATTRDGLIDTINEFKQGNVTTIEENTSEHKMKLNDKLAARVGYAWDYNPSTNEWFAAVILKKYFWKSLQYIKARHNLDLRLIPKLDPDKITLIFRALVSPGETFEDVTYKNTCMINWSGVLSLKNLNTSSTIYLSFEIEHLDGDFLSVVYVNNANGLPEINEMCENLLAEEILLASNKWTGKTENFNFTTSSQIIRLSRILIKSISSTELSKENKLIH